MTENTLLYTYTTKVCERWDLTKEELEFCALKEIYDADQKNYNLILTGKGYDNRSFFEAFSSGNFSKNFVWIHYCPQDILNFDDEKNSNEKYYMLTFTGYAKDGLYI